MTIDETEFDTPDEHLEVEFVDVLPSKTRRSSTKYDEFATLIKGRIGDWAIWPFPCSNPYSTATNINKGKLSSFPRDGFEARVVRKTLYVRALERK